MRNFLRIVLPTTHCDLAVQYEWASCFVGNCECTSVVLALLVLSFLYGNSWVRLGFFGAIVPLLNEYSLSIVRLFSWF